MISAVARTDRARTAELFHALSDETRLAILDMLRGGEQCVCDLQDELDAAQSRMSFHLRVLREAGLVSDRKEGRWSYYAIVPEALDEAHDLIVNFLPRSTSASARSRVSGVGVRISRAALKVDCCR